MTTGDSCGCNNNCSKCASGSDNGLLLVLVLYILLAIIIGSAWFF